MGEKEHAALAAVFLVVLALENSMSMLARRYATGVLKLQFNKNSVLMMNELIKMLFSVVMTLTIFNDGRRHGLTKIVFILRKSLKMAVPAVIYLIVNLISYPALERIDASVFTAVSQLKVLATALCATAMLGTTVSLRKVQRHWL
jgi:UDP-sugar transporter A1/2/3